jgi:PTH1 family peptidyl-tRNA hydrolase
MEILYKDSIFYKKMLELLQNFYGRKNMFLIVGLGNPGKSYENTRHNIGFRFVEALAKGQEFEAFKNKFNAQISAGSVGDEKIILLKPQTFMNNSGAAVLEAANFYKIPISNILVVHDDMDLELGRVKIKCGGGAAGHNGIRSIDNIVGNAFWRLRLGIGRSDKLDGADFVLGQFLPAENEKVEDIFAKLIKNLPLFFKGQPEMLISKLYL